VALAESTEVDPLNWTTRDVKLIEGFCCIMAATAGRSSAVRDSRAKRPPVLPSNILATVSGHLRKSQAA
jgi:hypothetical protein